MKRNRCSRLCTGWECGGWKNPVWIRLAALWSFATVFAATAQAQQEVKVFDLSHAVIVVPGDNPVHAKAADLVADETAQRTGLHLQRASALPGPDVPAILLGNLKQAGMPTPPNGLALPDAAEGYALWVDVALRKAPTVCLVGRDDRGLVFAAGRLLRELHLAKGKVSLDAATRLAAAPQSQLRGHQIGYRNTANSYDAWTVEQFEQYYRDLIVFGSNSFELIPDLDPTRKDSPKLMTEPMWTRNQKLAKVIASYGMQVWLWLPVDADLTKDGAGAEELAKQKALFASLSPIDEIMVPGGDPGDNAPEVLLPFLEKMAANLHAAHPKAGLWLSNQGFTKEQNDYFFAYLKDHQPDWLAGVVHGPWAKVTLQEMRERTPARYPLRRYPDICHCVRCEFAVPQWDRAFAHTLGREPFNPRPRAYAHIQNWGMAQSIGFLSYSDGVTDDVNKIIWTARAWDPNTDVEAILREYGRYFIGETYADDVAKGLLALERNWEGPALENTGIEDTLALWQSLEQRGGAELANNWRFQLMLLRATYDAYVRQRLIFETDLEDQANAALGRVREVGPAAAIDAARKALAQADAPRPTDALRARIEKLGAALWKSIGLQLDVKRYGASGSERGAVLEFLNTPLNNRAWLESEFTAILNEVDRAAQLKRIDAVVHWEDPGPGGFYDDLGNGTKEPHLVRQVEWQDDPSYARSPQEEYFDKTNWRLSWEDQAETLYGVPLKMHYDGLDPAAKYRLRVMYTGRFKATMRLTANGALDIHGPLAQPAEPKPIEFELPTAATQGGTLDLQWDLVEGRGCQVGEVWLVRNN